MRLDSVNVCIDAHKQVQYIELIDTAKITGDDQCLKSRRTRPVITP